MVKIQCLLLQHRIYSTFQLYIQEGSSVAKNKERKMLSHAKVVGTACDVCKPEDVKKLVKFSINEPGSVDIWTVTGIAS
ncbi:hypothetical protein SORBI_3009G115100 [Sorghum bicolor]|uniref:Uncharacterized protein n=2 Tax=Sorghum bicolor TaxID=4558 RepID=A0A1Z5R2W4_SORBI|nr:hypothetical protein SORBI_3009G115100 [Sorghum bicolor]